MALSLKLAQHTIYRIVDGYHHQLKVVGDSVLDGELCRSSTVIAVTDCEFAAFDDSEFHKIMDQGPSQMSVEERCQYLR